MHLLFVSFILGDSNRNFFQVGYPVDSPTNSAMKQTPLLFRRKVYEIARSEVLATQMGVTESQHQLKSARLNCTNLTHFRLTAGRFRGNSCTVMLWVACELLQFAATQ